MVEENQIFSSNLKFTGIFTFSDFYKFCYDWLVEEIGLDVAEEKYGEKIKVNEKEIKVEWVGTKKLTDYFQFKMKVKFSLVMLKTVEVVQNGKKIKTNDGEVKVDVKGILVRDYQSKFEKTASMKFIRSIYEKWVITSRVEQFENKIFGDCDEFLAQAKSWLDMAGNR
ncbi:MAG: hypothetical protein KKF67_00785 [Nanoarchaeota archaeon]|nr:hypothetical protein [Nanoarchaeota archaeon]